MSEENNEVEVAAEEAVEVSPEQQELETRARRMGWVPKEEFRGDPAKHVSAERFIERGENELPILRERFRRTEERLVRQEKLTENVQTKLTETTQVLTEFRNMAAKAEERAYAKAKRDLERQMAEAAAEGNATNYHVAKQELDALEPPNVPSVAPAVASAAPQPQAQQAQIDPATLEEIQAWARENPWFNTDGELHQEAVEVYGMLERTRPQLSTRERLAEVKKRVVATYPTKFENRARSAPASVATPTANAPTPRGKKKSIKDLPADAQAAYAKFKRSMPDYPEEEYIKMYEATQ